MGYQLVRISPMHCQLRIPTRKRWEMISARCKGGGNLTPIVTELSGFVPTDTRGWLYCPSSLTYSYFEGTDRRLSMPTKLFSQVGFNLSANFCQSFCQYFSQDQSQIADKSAFGVNAKKKGKASSDNAIAPANKLEAGNQLPAASLRA